uniref:Uncharacterized protein n=1 Tax=Arundo donax TaxID=35708 RepID=A0A0A9GCT4_ARUDO
MGQSPTTSHASHATGRDRNQIGDLGRCVFLTHYQPVLYPTN